MVRCDWCKIPENVERLREMCEKDESTFLKIEQIARYIQAHPQICELSGGAVMPLITEKDPETEAKALEAVGKNIAHGNIPTAKQVKKLLENKRAGIKPKGHVSNDLSGIYRPPVQTPILEIPPDEYVVIGEDVVDEEDVMDEEDVVIEEDTSITPSAEADSVEGIPQMPVLETLDDILVVEGNKDEDEEEEEDKKKNRTNEIADDQARLERLKEREEQRADNEAEKIVATCLKAILRRGYPGHKLNWLVTRAVSDVLIPDRGCPMPDSGSVTQGGAITTNLGGR